MGRNSQEKKERHTRKRQEKRKKQAQARARSLVQRPVELVDVASGANARHRRRLEQQIPRAWPGETPEDVAVFDDTALAALPPETAQQVSVVREALQDASESRGEVALQRTSVIPRNSPLSEWRLFIRGLVSWLAEDVPAADEAWKRLNAERRPGRIAAAMTLALRSDLEQTSSLRRNGEPDGESPSPSENVRDASTLYHAKLLRRTRFDRAAIRIAQVGMNVPEESRKLLLGPRKLEWLQRFVAEYGDTEPALTAALSHAALNRAYVQEYSDVFESAAKTLQGPPHDRRNRLLVFFFFSRFEGAAAESKAQGALDEYLKNDLPRNEALSAPLRGAVASQIHLNEARFLLSNRGGGMMRLLYGTPPNPKAIRERLRASVKADRANRAAYEAHVEWIESELDNDRLTKPKRKPWEDELAEVMRNWSQGLPEDAEPRLWLIDYLLEHEQTEEAKPHVDFLAASRQDDPRVRATPWKWQLLEAMRLCRRKAWLAEVPARLDEAEKLWPTWLSKQWLPYLRAAWEFRSGHADACEERRRQICQESGLARDSLADACMMLGAAQRMSVPANELAQFRAPVDQATKRLKALSLQELLEAGGFFWDLHRAQALYPAYKMHGGKFGKALLALWRNEPRLTPESLQDARVHKSLLWCSEHRFWSSSYDLQFPPFYADPAVQSHPIFAAAKLNAYLKARYHWRSENYLGQATLLREAARAEPDAYYRHWFAALAEELDDVRARVASQSRGFSFFSDLFGDDGEDEDDDDEI